LVLNFHLERLGGEFDLSQLSDVSGGSRGAAKNREASELGNNLFQNLQLFSA
jgi:hypothetical protein